MTDAISAGLILSRTFVLLRRGAARAAAALVVLTGLGALADTGVVDPANANAIDLIASGASLAANYWITKSLLEEQTGRKLPARFGAFFGLSLISTLGILLGLIILVIPGVILAIRWSASTPILLDTDDGVTEAMQRSWRVTGPHFWSILLALLAIYGACLGLGAAAELVRGVLWGRVPALIISDLAIEAALIAGWHAAVAIYSLIGMPDRLAETFE